VHDLVPIAGMMTGLIITGAVIWALVRVTQGPIGQAFARRVQGRHGVLDEETRLELAELRERVDLLQDHLLETQERLDFTERLLSQQRQPNQLPG